MKKLLFAATLLVAPVAMAQDFKPGNASALSGDQADACAAVLCLSSSVRPGECSAALMQYFNIVDKKPWKQVQKRLNFLNMCPASHQPGMASLVEAIAEGAGNCDVDSLNKSLAVTKRVQKCDANGRCSVETVRVIGNSKPQACSAYESNPYTNITDSAKYVGEPERGGKWVAASEYEAAKKAYDKRIKEEDEERERKEREAQRKWDSTPAWERDNLDHENPRNRKNSTTRERNPFPWENDN